VLATIASIISNIVFISWDAQIIQNKSSYKQTNNDDFNIKKLRCYNYDSIMLGNYAKFLHIIRFVEEQNNAEAL
jgi:hypothetical protein